MWNCQLQPDQHSTNCTCANKIFVISNANFFSSQKSGLHHYSQDTTSKLHKLSAFNFNLFLWPVRRKHWRIEVHSSWSIIIITLIIENRQPFFQGANSCCHVFSATLRWLEMTKFFHYYMYIVLNLFCQNYTTQFCCIK